MSTRDIRNHSSDDMTGLGELADVMEPVAVVIRPDGSIDAYGQVAVVDQQSNGITEERVKLTADWLRGVVWGQATNPASKPVVKAMAKATERRDWASLLVLAEALGRLEALTCVLDANPAAGNVAKRAAAFARLAMADPERFPADDPDCE